jgi:hypothetical protein
MTSCKRINIWRAAAAGVLGISLRYQIDAPPSKAFPMIGPAILLSRADLHGGNNLYIRPAG